MKEKHEKKIDFILPPEFVVKNKKMIEKIKEDILLKKGFHYLFMGIHGAGKTYLAHIILDNLRGIYFDKPKIVDCTLIYEKYKDMQFSNYTDRYEMMKKIKNLASTSILVLDRLGEESEKSHAFIKEMIERRYGLYVKNKAFITIITTPIKGSRIQDIYGESLIDRIYEMFVIMKFPWDSFRRKKMREIR